MAHFDVSIVIETPKFGNASNSIRYVQYIAMFSTYVGMVYRSELHTYTYIHTCALTYLSLELLAMRCIRLSTKVLSRGGGGRGYYM